MALHRALDAVADPPPHLSPRPPGWVDDALGAEARQCDRDSSIEVRASGLLLLLRTSVIGARGMSADELRARVSDTYVAVGAALDAFNRHPIRFWNFIPSPGKPMGGGLDRYMVFNAGRFDGYARWRGGSSFGPSLPTASGVGTIGDDLVVQCLATDVAGTPVENPRQKPAWQYSTRYGPMPPCFSRATIATVAGRRLLLIGGTASIVGEDSQHVDDVDGQLAETLKNLEALIDAARGTTEGTGTPLAQLIDLRVYLSRAADAPLIREVLGARCPRAARIDLAIARVCRPELLVEIEGVAAL